MTTKLCHAQLEENLGQFCMGKLVKNYKISIKITKTSFSEFQFRRPVLSEPKFCIEYTNIE